MTMQHGVHMSMFDMESASRAASAGAARAIISRR